MAPLFGDPTSRRRWILPRTCEGKGARLMSAGDWFTATGLGVDILGAVLLGIASGIRLEAVRRSMGALRPSGVPKGKAATRLRLMEKTGWLLLVLGFILQLIGVPLE
jgi:hypothetical protein